MMADIRMLQEQNQQLQVVADAARRHAEGAQRAPRRAGQRQSQGVRRSEPEGRSVRHRPARRARARGRNQRPHRVALAGGRGAAACRFRSIQPSAPGAVRPVANPAAPPADPAAPGDAGAPRHAAAAAARAARSRDVAAAAVRHRVGRLHVWSVGPVHQRLRDLPADVPASSELADEAQFYIGECNYSERQAPGGRAGLQPGDHAPIRAASRSRRRTTSAGLAFEQLGQLDRARESFEQVVKNFPTATPRGWPSRISIG